ncbi:MAG: RsmE family RNA methyltransferase [Patescibacteria group bacterium]
MRLHRFIGKFDLNRLSVSLTDKDMVNQICNVLRLKVGDRVALGDGNLGEAIGKISELGKKEIKIQIQQTYRNENEPNMQVTLFAAVLKRENFELLVQKATEVGVSGIVPIITERTVKLGLNQARLQKIIREAAEQSGRGFVPAVSEPVKLAEAVKLAAKNDTNIVFDTNGNKLSDTATKIKIAKNIGIFVGPEGGWTEEELTALRREGFIIASLGKLTLRAETAGIISSYIIAQIVRPLA